MRSLNSKQQAAVDSNHPLRIVIAGPGSGKTHTLIASINRDVHDRGTDPSKIVVITFTTAGAREFTRRLGGIRIGFAGTRHAYLFKMLQKHGGMIGYRNPRDLTIIRPEDMEALLKGAATRLGYKKTSMKAIMERRDTPDVKAIWLEAESSLKRANMVSYDGILADGSRLLEARRDQMVANREVVALYVDEAQDNSEEDWKIDMLIPADRRFIVGDPDQSIFAFRGAKPEILVEAASRKDAQTFLLTDNYRSGSEIVEAANALIQKNKKRVPKDMRAVQHTTGGVFLCPTETDHEELLRISDAITESACDESEIAVLARTNRLAKSIAEFLRGDGHYVETEEVYKPGPDYFLAVDYISLLANPNNEMTAKRVAKATGMTDELIRRERLSKGGYTPVAYIMTGIQLADREDALRSLHYIPDILSRMKIHADVVEIIKGRIAGLPASAALSDLLVDLHRPEAWEAEGERKGVTVTTIHRSKGREWDSVIVAGVTEGCLPNLSKSSDIEEERRLAFVALTRARKQVQFTWPEERKEAWGTSVCQHSRFIGEMIA